MSAPDYIYASDGSFRRAHDVQGMMFPVLCSCGQVYDIGTVEPTARYADCDVWITPCCKRQEDNRAWTRRYTELDRNGREKQRR